jgi:hypothetical protein
MTPNLVLNNLSMTAVATSLEVSKKEPETTREAKRLLQFDMPVR